MGYRGKPETHPRGTRIAIEPRSLSILNVSLVVCRYIQLLIATGRRDHCTSLPCCGPAIGPGYYYIPLQFGTCAWLYNGHYSGLAKIKAMLIQTEQMIVA